MTDSDFLKFTARNYNDICELYSDEAGNREVYVNEIEKRNRIRH